MNLNEKPLSAEYPYRGRIVNLRVDQGSAAQRPSGRAGGMEHPGGVCVAALTDREELLFVRQFRYPYQEVILELPAGKAFPGEDPLACGVRELKEETGPRRSGWSLWGGISFPGYTDEIIYLFWPPACPFGTVIPTTTSF